MHSGAAFFKAPDRSTSAQHSGDQSGRNGGAGLFQGLTVSVKEKKGGMKKLTDLPHEIVRYTASCLDVRSIAALAQTCRYLKSAVHDMAVEKMAHCYYGPPGSELRRQYDTLYAPLAERLYPLTEPHNRTTVPLSEEQQAKQCLYQITRLRTLSQSGQLKPTCETLETKGFYDLLAHGLSRPWGACALLSGEAPGLPCEEQLYIVALNPTPSFIEVLPIKQLSYSVHGAQILPDGHIVTVGRTPPEADTNCHFFLTLCKHDDRGDAVQQVLLAGTHKDKIIRFGQLADGRVVSASHDGTLKIRPLEPLDDTLVSTLTGHQSWITDMLLFAASRCITSSIDLTVKIWDLSRPSQEYCIATVADFPRVISKLYKLDEERFLSESGPNVILVWRLTDSGAEYTAMLDPDWPTQLDSNDSRTAPLPPYELAAENPPRLRPCLFDTHIVLPGGRIAVQHWSSIRRCDTTALHSEPKRLCILARNNRAAVTHSLPICPIGPCIVPQESYYGSMHLLPDGRLVHAEEDGTLYCHSFGEHGSTNSATLGDVLCNLPQQYQRTYRCLEWMTVMDDGRLFICTMMRDDTTVLLLYDPYALPKSSDNPDKRPDSANREKQDK